MSEAGNVIYLSPRAAKETKTSAVRPPTRAVSVAKIAFQRSAGTLSRCRHLEAAEGLTPISFARASTVAQRPITSRNVVKRMTELIRRQVLEGKENFSSDAGDGLSEGSIMETEDTYAEAFTRRVYSAREHASLRQEDVADVLGIQQSTYSKYEFRTPLPHRYIRAFCMLCRVNVEWLVTGQGKGPALLERPPKRKRGPNRTRRQRKAA
jgi:ribosome-binding protein aMBF1 (putative translation factor)